MTTPAATTAIVLAGGKGARLKPFTMTIPKPLLPLGDVPILEVVMRQLVQSGVQRIVLALGHMSPLFTSFFGDGSRLGAHIDYCFEEHPRGTAGAIRLVNDLSDDFLVMNGDILTDLDYGELLAAHRSQGAWGTIAVSARTVSIDFGVVVATPEGRLGEYREKPTINYDVSMGINVLSRRCLDFIPTDGPFDMPALMVAMMRAGKPVVCHKTDCYWQDIGRFDDYQRASDDFVRDPGRFVSNWTP